MRVFSGVLPSDSHATCARSSGKEHVGQLFTLQGKEHVPVTEIGPGDIGAVAKLKEVVDRRCARDRRGDGRVPADRAAEAR